MIGGSWMVGLLTTLHPISPSCLVVRLMTHCTLPMLRLLTSKHALRDGVGYIKVKTHAENCNYAFEIHEV
jgi:hypothetical protein